MPDTDVDAAPDTDDQVSPDSDDSQATSADDTTASAGDDSQVDDTQIATGDEPTGDDGGEPAKGRSTAFKKLLDKYGGDEEALVNAYFEQANSASRLHAELEELRDFLMAQPDEEDPEELIQQDPDVQGLSQELNSLQKDIEAVQQEQMQLVGTYGQIEQEIKMLEAQAEKAEDFEKSSLRSEANSKKAELRQIMSQVNRGRRELNAINRNIVAVERSQQKAREAVLGRKEQQRKAELQSAQVARLTREEFNSAMRAEAEGYGIDPSSKQFQVLNTSVRNQLAAHLNRLPPDTPAVNIKAATKHLMGEFADAMGLKSRFQKTTQAKGRTPVTSGPKGPPLPAGVKEPPMPKGMQQFGKDGKNWTLEFAKARAAKLLGD